MGYNKDMKYGFAKIQALHKKYAPTDAAYQMVFTHCMIVSDITKQLIKDSSLEIDAEVAITGALLHDIGVYHYFDNNGELLLGKKSVAHGVDSEEILKSEGLPESIWRIGSHHTGIYLSEQDVIDQELPVPIKDYSPRTAEELIVMYADKFHTKGPTPIFNSFDWYRNDVSKFGKDKSAKFDSMAANFGKPDLEILSKKYSFAIR